MLQLLPTLLIQNEGRDQVSLLDALTLSNTARRLIHSVLGKFLTIGVSSFLIALLTNFGFPKFVSTPHLSEKSLRTSQMPPDTQL